MPQSANKTKLNRLSEATLGKERPVRRASTEMSGRLTKATRPMSYRAKMDARS